MRGRAQFKHEMDQKSCPIDNRMIMKKCHEGGGGLAYMEPKINDWVQTSILPLGSRDSVARGKWAKPGLGSSIARRDGNAIPFDNIGIKEIRLILH